MIRHAAPFAALLLLPAGCAVPPPQPARPVARPAPPPPPPREIEGADFLLDRAPEQGGIAYGRVPRGTVSLTLDGRAVTVAPDGRFLIAFGRDHGPGALLEAIDEPGLVGWRQELVVTPRRWDTQSLPTLSRGTTPTPAFLARRKAELRRIAAARAILSPATEGWRGPFAWPVTGRISGVFGSQRIYAGEPGDYHGGVDIARPAGTPVLAPADGVVVLAAEAPFTLEGNLLIVDHGMGLNSAFLHLARIDVAVGQRLHRGDPDRPDRHDRPRDRPAPPLGDDVARRADRSAADRGADALNAKG